MGVRPTHHESVGQLSATQWVGIPIRHSGTHAMQDFFEVPLGFVPQRLDSEPALLDMPFPNSADAEKGELACICCDPKECKWNSILFGVTEGRGD